MPGYSRRAAVACRWVSAGTAAHGGEPARSCPCGPPATGKTAGSRARPQRLGAKAVATSGQGLYVALHRDAPRQAHHRTPRTLRRLAADHRTRSRDLVEGQGATADYEAATTTGHDTRPRSRVGRQPATNLPSGTMCSGCVQQPAITADPHIPGQPQKRGFTLRTRPNHAAAPPTTGPRSTLNSICVFGLVSLAGDRTCTGPCTANGERQGHAQQHRKLGCAWRLEMASTALVARRGPGRRRLGPNAMIGRSPASIGWSSGPRCSMATAPGLSSRTSETTGRAVTAVLRAHLPEVTGRA